MKVLIVGSGGREHTLVWACSRSGLKPEVYCAPGNGGTDLLGRNPAINPGNLDEISEFVKANSIDLTIVGPEAPLVDGLTDILISNGYKVFGPSMSAAKIEGSKAFAKELLFECGIPTADSASFKDFDKARAYINSVDHLLVVKTSGLAAGKGAIVCDNKNEAVAAAKSMLKDAKFGSAGSEIVVEERLSGTEATILAFVDGEDYLLLPPSRDHKPAYDDNKGPNTGGMGAYAPLDDLSVTDVNNIAETVFPPILKKMVEIGSPYSGVLYAGMILTDDGPKVIEFNCRFGDPEAQVVLPILKVDPLEIMLAVAEGRLGRWMTDHDIEKHDWQKLTGGRHAATVVVAVEGYPGSYTKGMKIENLPEETDDIVTFHAGTTHKDERLVSSGGRIVAVTGLGGTHEEAVETAYSSVEEVVIAGTRYRKDIGR